jgi:hypothetical protein
MSNNPGRPKRWDDAVDTFSLAAARRDSTSIRAIVVFEVRKN